MNDPYVYLLVSCVFWRQKRVNQHCDADDIISVTQLVNGGQNGLDSRKAYLAKAKGPPRNNRVRVGVDLAI